MISSRLIHKHSVVIHFYPQTRSGNLMNCKFITDKIGMPMPSRYVVVKSLLWISIHALLT